MRAFLFLALLGLSLPATAQTSAGSLWDRLLSIDPATVTADECDAQAARAAVLNGLDLFYASSLCHVAGRPVEASFLLNAGQIRSVADMLLIVPETKADSDRTVELYGFIYSYAGGPGSDEVLRDPQLSERFFRLYDGWSPVYDAEYNPGWNARRRPDASAYQAAIAQSKSGRRQQLIDMVRLLSDEIYYDLHRRFEELQARTSGRYVEGTPETELSRELQRQMNERAVALGLDHMASGVELTEPSNARFPPHAPAADELVQTASADPTVQHCADLAERITIAAESEIVRVLITRSPEWGTIWRADIAGARPLERFTCTERTSSSRPLDLGEESIPPLPE